MNPLSSLTKIAAVCSVAAFGSFSTAQETVESIDVDVQAVQEEGGPPMVISATRTSDGKGGSSMRIISADPSGAMPIFMGDGASFSFAGGPDFGAPDAFNMLQNPSVQKDLELVGDQMDKINAIQKEFNDSMRDHIDGLSKGNFDPGNAKKMGETIRDLQAKQKSNIEGLLLDHQKERLQQIAFQIHQKRAGTSGALTNSKWAEALGLDKDQIKRIKAKAAELKKEREERVKKLDEEMKKRLLEELTPDQRKKIDDMTGEKYEAKSEDWKERFAPRMKRMKRLNKDN